MKNILRNTFILPLIALAATAMLAGCSDWTEDKSLKFKDPSEGENYPKYLEDLRQYRSTDHKTVLAWFDNPDIAISMGQCLTAIPDSVDIVNLINPAELPDWTVRQMNTIQQDKGMKVIYTVDYVAVEDDYTAYVNSYSGDPLEMEEFLSFLTSYFNTMLPLCNKYGYDGISFRYDGMITIHLTQTEIEEYENNQRAFMSEVEQWVASNPDKLFIFEGNPENLLDKTILNSADYIVLRSENVNSIYGLANAAIVASGDGVPTDRFIVAVSTVSLDTTDEKTGYFYGADGSPTSAIPLAAQWVATDDASFTKKGLGIYNIQNDYYNTYLNYQYTREAIYIMNPSPKY